MKWITDPTTGKPSVSLTIFMISFAIMVAGTIFEAFHIIKSTALLDELFFSSIGLYWGRRNLSFNGKSINLDDTPKP